MVGSCNFLCMISCALPSVFGWNYKNHGPDRWSELYDTCGGMYQSPINIPTAIPFECNNSSKLSLDWEYPEDNTDFIVKNNGHSLIMIPVRVQSGLQTIEVLSQNNNAIAALNNIFYDTYYTKENARYCLDSLHFHWGRNDVAGSEHSFDNQYSALELHFLHYSCDYPNLSSALQEYLTGNIKDKYVLSAIGVLFEVGQKNKELNNILSDGIINEIYQIGGKDTDNEHKISHILTSINITNLLPSNLEFFAYDGSITAPPCLETVRWNVLKHKLTVSSNQLKQFRLLLESYDINDKLVNNHRPIQNNTNKIYYCNKQVSDMYIEPNKNEHALSIIIIASSVLFFFICLIGVCRYNKKRKEIGFKNLLSISTNQDNESEMGMTQIMKNDKYTCYN